MWNSEMTVLSFMYREAKGFSRDESGVTSIEYALVAALIAMVIVATVTNVGAAVLGLYQFVANEVAAAV